MIKTLIRGTLRKFGYDLATYMPDFDDLHKQIVKTVQPYTVTSVERLFSLIEAVKYVVANDIPGDFVECGVYKGGSMMAIAMTLVSEGITDRELYLYDTFEGMPKPDEVDVDWNGKPAAEMFDKTTLSETSSTWSNCPLDAVKEAIASTGYPDERVHYVKGLVEETIPEVASETIALLRLDTDFYGSTKHELVHLYPRLSDKGILIIDDYGYFRGSKQAVDEFFSERNEKPYLHRIDDTGRLIIKT